MPDVQKVPGTDIDKIVDALLTRSGLAIEYRKCCNANWARVIVDCGCEDEADEVACVIKREMAELGIIEMVSVSGTKIVCNFGMDVPWGRNAN